MSHFTVALNEVLDRMKVQSGTTRQGFAERIGVPMSTLAAWYTEGRNRPDAKALGRLSSGVNEDDGRKLILAHLQDETPEEWHGRLNSVGTASRPADLSDLGLPLRFRIDLETLIEESRKNPHVAALCRELVILISPAPKERGTPKKDKWQKQSLAAQSETPVGPANTIDPLQASIHLPGTVEETSTSHRAGARDLTPPVVEREMRPPSAQPAGGKKPRAEK